MKWAPNKLIWHVQLVDKETQYPVQDFYFLFKWAAHRFMERNYERAEELDCNLMMGGESLFLLW